MNILIEEIKEKFQNKEIIPVIGAGVSRTVARLPNWSGLIYNAIKYLQDHKLIEPKEADSIQNLIDKNQLINAAGELEQIFKFPSNNFAQWINHELHAPTIANTTLIDNIESLCPPFLITTNYDTLISNGTIRYTKELSWSQPESLRRCITENEKFVFHLHGIYTDPDHLVFGTKGYESIMNSNAYRDILNLVWLSKSLIFIGCSRDGVLDEDLIITIKRFRENFINTSHKHYILLREEEADVVSIRNFLREYNIQIVIYGKNYEDLAPFILELNTSKEDVDAFVKVKNEFKNFLKNTDENNVEVLTKLKRIYEEAVGSKILDPSQFIRQLFDKRQEKSKGSNHDLRCQQEYILNLLSLDTLKNTINKYSRITSIDDSTMREICDIGCKAFDMLRAFPVSTLLRINRKYRWKIHDQYLSGNLNRYPYMWKKFLELNNFDYVDNYFLENMTRISRSLEDVLTVEPDDIFPELNLERKLLNNYLTKSIIVTSSDEIAIFASTDIKNKLAFISSEDGLPFIKAEIIKYNGKTLVVGINNEIAFVWNPYLNSFIEPFFTIEDEDNIRNLSISYGNSGEIEIIVLTDKLELNFKDLNLTISNPNLGLIYENYRVDWSRGELIAVDKENKIVLTKKEIWQMINQIPLLKAEIDNLISKINDRELELFGCLNDSDLVFSHEIVKILTLENTGYISLRIKLMHSFSGNDLLIFFIVNNNQFEIKGYHLTKEGNSFLAFDSTDYHGIGHLAIGNLAYGTGNFDAIQLLRKTNLREYFVFTKHKSFLPYPESKHEILKIKVIDSSKLTFSDDKKTLYLLDFESGSMDSVELPSNIYHISTSN